MAKVRTAVSLSEPSYDWLCEHASSTGEMSEYIDFLLQRERTLSSVDKRVTRQLDRLETILNTQPKHT